MELKNNEQDEIQENILYAESIFGRNTQKGLVRLSHGITFELVISPEEARFFALSILEAAQAAETDEILMTWLGEAVGITNEKKRAQVLLDFRQIRIKMRETELIEAKNAGT